LPEFGNTGWILATQILAKQAEIRSVSKYRNLHRTAVLCQIPMKLVGIWPLPPNSDIHCRNLATIVEILLANDRISTLVPFRRLYFFVRAKSRKLFSGKNNFVKNILHRNKRNIKEIKKYLRKIYKTFNKRIKQRNPIQCGDNTAKTSQRKMRGEGKREEEKNTEFLILKLG